MKNEEKEPRMSVETCFETVHMEFHWHFVVTTGHIGFISHCRALRSSVASIRNGVNFFRWIYLMCFTWKADWVRRWIINPFCIPWCCDPKICWQCLQSVIAAIIKMCWQFLLSAILFNVCESEKKTKTQNNKKTKQRKKRFFSSWNSTACFLVCLQRK